MNIDRQPQAVIRNKETGQFRGFGRWVSEYPDAQLFTIREALEQAMQLRKQQRVEVVVGYGTADEKAIFDSRTFFEKQFTRKQRFPNEPELE